MAEGDTLAEVETLTEDFLPPVYCVLVLRGSQTEHLSEKVHTEKPQEAQVADLATEELKPPEPIKEKLQRKTLATDRVLPKRQTYSPRRFFTDHWNSMWHFVFGVFSIKFPLLVPLFILYQCMTDLFNDDIFVDIWEFLIGHIFGYLFYII